MFGLKKKLMAAVAMLTVSAMMLTTASFAWFTISTNPEISGLSTTVVVNENLEIAVAKSDGETTPSVDATIAQTDYTTESMVSNYYTYGNLVDFTNYTGLESGSLGYDYNAFLTNSTADTTEDDVMLAPMAVNEDEDGFVYPIYGLDGRVDSVKGELYSSKSNGSFGTLEDGDGNIYGYYIDFWMRSNVGGDVLLTTEVDRANGNAEDSENGSEDDDNVMGGGSTFTSTNEELAGGIGIAFATITDSSSILVSATGITGYTSLSESDNTTGVIVVEATSAEKEDDDGNWVTEFDDETVVATLTANVDTLVRMYVYLDGTNVSNASASLVDALTTGTLNVQFGIEEVDDAMNTTLVTATVGDTEEASG